MLGVYYIEHQLSSNSNKKFTTAKLLVARRVTLGFTFALLLQILGWWQGPMNDILSVYKCRLSKIGTLTGGWDTQTLTAKSNLSKLFAVRGGGEMRTLISSLLTRAT